MKRVLINNVPVPLEQLGPDFLLNEYEISHWDQDVYVPKIQACRHTGTRQIKKQCCGFVDILYCTLYERDTTRVACTRCMRTGQDRRKEG